MNLSNLTVKCLYGMPVITDSLINSINELKCVFNQYHEEYSNIFEKEIVSERRIGFTLLEEECENINLFGEEECYEKEFGIDYRMKYIQNKKINPIIFELFFEEYYI